MLQDSHKIYSGKSLKNKTNKQKHCPENQRPTLESDFKTSSFQYLVSTIMCQAGYWEVDHFGEQEVNGCYPHETYSASAVPVNSFCDHGQVT